MFALPSTKADDEQLFLGDIAIFIQKFRVGRSQPGSVLAGSELSHWSQCLDNHKSEECCEGEWVNDTKHILKKKMLILTWQLLKAGQHSFQIRKTYVTLINTHFFDISIQPLVLLQD